MMISTRGRYALRFMVDLAENQESRYITTRDIAERQEVSVKYAERLMSALSKGRLIEAQHGRGGGYRLTRDPADYKVGEILRLMEEELAPVACLANGPSACHRAATCRTLPMWQKLGGMINNFLDGITLADLMASSVLSS